jgi:hypothetical protein
VNMVMESQAHDREKYFEQRLAEVKAWLNENVLVPEAPIEISISEIQFDWQKMYGNFSVSLDERKLKDRFSVSMQITGRVAFTPPMFTSPLGVPASYAAVKLCERTESAIQRVLERVFPRVRAYGWHKDIDLIIDAYTPFARRILDQDEFDQKRLMIERGDLVASEKV